jgi:hypothetical protein
VFTAAKNAKESLSRGLTLFNTKDPVKGLQALMSSGLVGGTPQEVSVAGSRAVPMVRCGCGSRAPQAGRQGTQAAERPGAAVAHTGIHPSGWYTPQGCCGLKGLASKSSCRR